jgi:signal transduction histidine kinase
MRARIFRALTLPAALRGLRPRLVGALVLTSVVTLGAAALALLSPLENRLRQDTTQNVLATVTATRPEFDDAFGAQGTVLRVRLARIARGLERRAGARVVILDAARHPLYNPDPDLFDPFDDVRRALRKDRTLHDVRNGILRIAMPVRIGGRRYAVAVRKALTEVSAANRVVTKALLPVALVALVIALVLGVLLAGRLLARLNRLRDAAVSLGPDHLDRPVPRDDHEDEIGELARAFAAMQERIAAAESARRAFVATASHELRTPVASLSTMLELLAEEAAEPQPDAAELRSRIGRARLQAARLGRLAEDLLDLSRIDADVPLRREPVEMTEICRAVGAEFEVRLAGDDGRLRVDLGDEPLWARGDPDAVARVVRILVDNALRHGQGAAVRVQARGEDGHVVAVVADDGPGIPEEEREIVFERFRRGGAQSGDSGFGLGLAIARELAGRMQGSLTLAPGQGARFELRLPALPAP